MSRFAFRLTCSILDFIQPKLLQLLLVFLTTSPSKIISLKFVSLHTSITWKDAKTSATIGSTKKFPVVLRATKTKPSWSHTTIPNPLSTMGIVYLYKKKTLGIVRWDAVLYMIEKCYKWFRCLFTVYFCTNFYKLIIKFVKPTYRSYKFNNSRTLVFISF
jgi:hypothetical protein